MSKNPFPRVAVLVVLAMINFSCGGGSSSPGASVGAVKIVLGAGRAELSWRPVPRATNYRIRHSKSPISGSGSEASVLTDGRVSAVVADLPPGTAYFSVEAIFEGNPGLESGSSAPLFDPTFTSNPGNPGDFFGWSVAGAGDVNGDGFDDWIVGAQSASPGGRDDAGSAFVYSGADGSLLYQKDGAEAGDNFAWSVSTAGDVNKDGHADFIVGAPNTGKADLGTAFVYSGADGDLLYAKTGEPETIRFGRSVGTAGDVNGDGCGDFIVGSPEASPGGKTSAGSAFVYSGADGALLYRKNGMYGWSYSGDGLGTSVGTAGDVNGDRLPDFIVGAPGAYTQSERTGAVYVFSGADGSLLHDVRGSDGHESSFGRGVGGAGDINGDDRCDFFVGASSSSSWDLKQNGAVYVYSGLDGSILHTICGGFHYAGLGNSVATAGDVNGDGYSDLIVQIPDGMNGMATVFSGRDRSILYQKFGNAGSAFASSVHAAGDANGDGKADFVVGAPYDNSTAGSAFLFMTTSELGIIPSETFDPFAADPFAPIRTPQVSPGGSRTFAASGGTPPYVWSVVTDNSGSGGITSEGAYTAGSTAGVYDTIRLTDSLGRSHDTRILVTDGLASAPAPVRRPLSLEAILVSSTQVDLTWADAASNETGYLVEVRAATEAWSTMATLDSDSTSFSATDLDPTLVYLFRVKAFNSDGDSPWSPETISTLPGPTGFAATPVSGTRIDLTWVDNSDAETGFRIQFRRDTEVWTTIAMADANSTSFSVLGLAPFDSYYFRVQSFSGTVESTWSPIVSANTPFP